LNAARSWGKILVVSPHLDDAVFSCGEWIARQADVVVATVFAGVPPAFDALTAWDAQSGFSDAVQAVTRRRQEDRAALDTLGATPLWLEFCDSQYRCTPTLAVLSAAMSETLKTHQPDTVLFPAGLFHSDHVLVHQAMLALGEKHPDKNWLMYEDALYRRLDGLLQQRLAGLLQAGIEATPLGLEQQDGASLKQQALHCYASQLRALSTTPNGYADTAAPERFWRLMPP
jgi:LmbE family N-acetylglucosaminyl deacetylase